MTSKDLLPVLQANIEQTTLCQSTNEEHTMQSLWEQDQARPDLFTDIYSQGQKNPA